MVRARVLVFAGVVGLLPLGGACDSAAPDADGAATSFLRQGCTNLDRLRVQDAWEVTRGDPQTIIAILDTGLAPFAQTPADTVPGRDLVTNDAMVVDTHGHGTALFAAIKGVAGGGDSGVCPLCKVMPIRVVADATTDMFGAVDARIAAGLRFARDGGARVALVGLVTDDYPPQTATAVAEIIASGVVVVAPAGADSYGIAGFPARLPGVVAVSGTWARQDFPIAQANGFGGVTVWAPSDSVSWPSVGSINGTSLASAYVAGIAGLVRSAKPSLSPLAVRSVLAASGVPLEPGEPMQLFSGGRIDARAAVDLALAAHGAVADVAYAEPSPARALPAQPGHVHVRVQNHGTDAADLGALSVVVDPIGATAAAGTGSLDPGESIWVDVPFTTSSRLGRNPMRARLAVAGGAAIDVSHSPRDVLRFSYADPLEQMNRLFDPGDGACPGYPRAFTLAGVQRRVADVIYDATHDIRLVDFTETTPLAPNAPRAFRAVYVNAGNTALVGGAIATLDDATIATLADESWEPGATRVLDIPIDAASAPKTESWRLTLKASVVDDDPTDDVLTVDVASGLNPSFRLAYADYKGTDIEFDAPYRVNVGGTTTRSADDDYIPFLAYVPEYEGSSNDRAVAFAIYARADHPAAAQSKVIDAQWTVASGARLLYADWRDGSGQGEQAFCTTCFGPAPSAAVCMRPCGAIAPTSGTTSAGTTQWRPTVLDENGQQMGPSTANPGANATFLFNGTDPLHYTRPDGLPKPPSSADASQLFDARHPGWHRIVRIPRRVVFEALGEGAFPRAIYFKVMLAIAKKGFVAPVAGTPLVDPLVFAAAPETQDRWYTPWSNDQNITEWSRVLRVVFDTLPRFAGRPNDRYYDAHAHTMAEGVIGGLSLQLVLNSVVLGTQGAGGAFSGQNIPSKEWGGPLAMLTETAFVEGFTPGPDLTASVLANRLITTDHNQFYSDAHDVIPPSWLPPSGPLAAAAGPDGASSHNGEMTIIRSLLGRTAGEELTIAGGLSPASIVGVPPTGRHALVYDANHFEGPWHGGDGNPWSVIAALAALKMQAETSAQAPVPSIFPAHPFQYVDATPDLSSPQWRLSDLEQLMGMWPANTTKAYAKRSSSNLVPLAPGYQIRNQKIQAASLKAHVEDYQQLDAWKYLLAAESFTTAYDAASRVPRSIGGDGSTQVDSGPIDLSTIAPTSQKGWRGQLVEDLALFSYLIRDGLMSYSLADDPGATSPNKRVYMRKVFGVGGNDAHGDFNFERINLSTLFDCTPTWLKYVGPTSGIRQARATSAGVADSAWGKVRTLALTDETDSASAFDAMVHGNAVVTDGPLARLDIDSDPWLDSAAAADPNSTKPVYSFKPGDPTNLPFDVDGAMGGTGPMGGKGTVLVMGIDTRVHTEDTIFNGQYGGFLWNLHCLGCWLVVPRLRFSVVNPSGLYDPFPKTDRNGLPYALQTGGAESDLTDVVAVLVRPNRKGPDVSVMGAYRPYPATYGGAAAFRDDVVNQYPYIQNVDASLTKGVLASDGDDGRGTSPTFGQRAALYLVAERDPAAGNGGSRWGGGTVAVTNPVWIGVARIDEFLINGIQDGVPKITDVRASVVFPISMAPIDPKKVFIQVVNADVSGGARIAPTTVTELKRPDGTSIDGVEGREFVMTWTGLSLAIQPSGGRSGIVLVLVKPHDVLDNELNSIAAYRDYPSSLPVHPYGPTDPRACEFVSGSCPSCAPGSNVPWCQRYAPPSCGEQTFCDYGNRREPFVFSPICADTTNDPNNCGVCGHTCGVDEECCASSCVPIDDPRNCGVCGVQCKSDGSQQCCHGANGVPACINLGDDANCGACGLACSKGTTCKVAMTSGAWDGAQCQ